MAGHSADMRPFSRPRAGLVLAGGGARGAYQAGVLKAVGELAGGKNNPFDIIAGLSVGSINAAALAAGSADFGACVRRIESLWSGLEASDIYRTDLRSVLFCSLHWLVTLAFAGIGVPTPRALLDVSPLEALLEREIDFDAIEHAIADGILSSVAVTASSYDDGRAKTFFQGCDTCKPWSRARRDGLRAKLTVDHLLASTALPLVFRTRKIGGEFFGDGALRLTAPLSPAIRLGADRILVIAVRDEGSDRMPDQRTRPSLGDMAGYLLDVLFNDNMNADIERLERINETVSLIADDRKNQTDLRHIGVHTIRPSRDLRHIAGEHAGELPWTIRSLLRGINAWGPDWRLPSYLLFEEGYCRALIDLGYRDAKNDQDKLASFLGLD